MKRYLFIIVLSSVLISCGNRSSSEKAVVGEAKAEVSEAGTLSVNTASSKIFWKGFKPGGSHNGTLSLKEGVLNVQGDAITGGRFLIDMNTIVDEDITDDSKEKLVTHLKSADFFDVAQFPTGEFVITSVTPKDGMKQTITGNLTLKGVTKSISFPVELSTENNHFAASAPAFTIDRTQWGVNYGSKNVFKNLKDSFINDEMEVKIQVVSQ